MRRHEESARGVSEREDVVRQLNEARKKLDEARQALVAIQTSALGNAQWQLLDPKTGKQVDAHLDGEGRVKFFEQQVKDLEALLVEGDAPSHAAGDSEDRSGGDMEVQDEGTGLDIPTINVPGAAAAPPVPPIKDVFENYSQSAATTPPTPTPPVDTPPPAGSVIGDISTSEFGSKSHTPSKAPDDAPAPAAGQAQYTPPILRGPAPEPLPPLTGDEGEIAHGITEMLPPTRAETMPPGTNPWAARPEVGRDIGDSATPPTTVEPQRGDMEVHDEGSGIDIPTIAVPGAAKGGGIPRAVFFVPVGVVLLLLLARTLTAGTDAGASSLPTTTSRAATAVPSTTSAPVLVTPTPQPTRTTPVFVVNGHPAAYIGGPKCSQMTVAFSWTIDGLGASGNYVLQFANYGQGYGPEQGPFTISASSSATQTWDPQTHLLTLRWPVGEIPTEWAARITKVLNTAVQGDAESKAPLSPCTQG